MPITQNINLSALNTVPQVANAVSNVLQNIQQTVNGLTLNDLTLDLVTVAFPGNQTIVTVNHGLGYIPNGYIPVQLDAAATIYLASEATPATAKTIDLVASAGCNAVILFF